MEIFLFLLLLPVLLGGSGYLYLNHRTKPIDHFKYPTLSRAHKIIRYRNTNAREKEAKKRELLAKREVQAIEARSIRESEEALKLQRTKTNAEFVNWDEQYSMLILPSVLKQQAIEAKKRQEAQAEADRQRVAAAQRAAELSHGEWRQTLESKAAQSNFWSRSSDNPDDGSYTDRYIAVHVANLRAKPTSKSPKRDVMVAGDPKISVNGWSQGEELYGNDVWFRLQGSGYWIWSGCLNNKSTSGIPRVRADGKTKVFYQSTRPNIELIVGDVWVETAEDGTNTYREWTGSKWKWKGEAQRASSGITSTKISANLITADKITVGGLLAPTETDYRIFKEAFDGASKPLDKVAILEQEIETLKKQNREWQKKKTEELLYEQARKKRDYEAQLQITQANASMQNSVIAAINQMYE